MGKHTNEIKKHKKALLFIIFTSVVVPLYFVLEAIFYKKIPHATWWGETIDTFVFTVFISLLIYSASTTIARWLEKKLPWSLYPKRRFIVEFIVVSISTLVIATSFTLAWYNWYVICDGPIERELFRVLTVALIVNTIATAIYEAVFLFDQWKSALLNAEKLKKENLQSQFDSLKNQVNPHFLFNSLNTLATIIPENPEQAVQFVQKLSNVYRYVLQYKDNETVDLRTELDCINAYCFLQKIRFGANLNVDIGVPEKYYKNQVPPLTLQILLENAIKHNIISLQKPLNVYIYVDDAGMLVTRNNLQKKKSVESSTKIGLQNLMNRFEYIYGQGIDIFETETDFLVKVPLG